MMLTLKSRGIAAALLLTLAGMAGCGPNPQSLSDEPVRNSGGTYTGVSTPGNIAGAGGTGVGTRSVQGAPEPQTGTATTRTGTGSGGTVTAPGPAASGR
jgi:hypothetical protein